VRVRERVDANSGRAGEFDHGVEEVGCGGGMEGGGEGGLEFMNGRCHFVQLVGCHGDVGRGPYYSLWLLDRSQGQVTAMNVALFL